MPIQWSQHQKYYESNINRKYLKSEQFDFVVGNPPYGAKVSKVDLNYFVEKYSDSGLNKIFSDTYISFYILGLNLLLKSDGILGYIAPNTWRLVSNGLEFRKFITSKKQSLHK